MGHIRLGVLPKSRKWQQVVGLLRSGADIDEVADAAALAAERDLARASKDPLFHFVAKLLVELPLAARAPGFSNYLDQLGLSENLLSSPAAFAAGISNAVDDFAFATGQRSDFGEMAQMALVENLTRRLNSSLPSLFDPEPSEIRKEIGKLSGSKEFAAFTRSFFASLTFKSLDYYLSRELASHTGAGERFETDQQRSRFEQALSSHTFEASRIVEEYAGGWYGKNVWQKPNLTDKKIRDFSGFAFKKIRSELGRRREL